MPEPRPNRTQLLLYTAETSLGRTLNLLLSKAGYDVTITRDPGQIDGLLTEQSIDLVLIDQNASDPGAPDLSRQLRRSNPEIGTLLLTADDNLPRLDLSGTAANDIIRKPFTDHQVLFRVEQVLAQTRLRKELLQLREQLAMNYGFDNIVGISRQVVLLKETASRIAPTDIVVLLTGESGTGKELFARAIHHHSERRHRSLITVDCSTLPESMIEPYLFGDQGSRRIGSSSAFEQAAGGTIFLDEIDSLPMAPQIRLVRYLQDSSLSEVNRQRDTFPRARIMAASSANLPAMVADGKFREDLYYRLNVLPFRLPALADRVEDIEILTDYFLRRIGHEIGKPLLGISREAVEKLLVHSWPGNIRELENTLKRGAVLCQSRRLEEADISFVSGDRDEQAIVGPTRTSLRIKGNLLSTSQRKLIVRALDENDWNYTKTAEELGIGRTTLWRKIKKYDLKRELVAD